MADGLPLGPSRPSEFKLVAGGDNGQILSSYGQAPSRFWLAFSRLWHQALPFSYPLFSELHPALHIPGHSKTDNASLKTDLGDIL